MPSSSSGARRAVRLLAVERKLSLKGFFAELRRRRVIRVLVLYAIGGWIIIQVAATVLPGLNVPAWSVTLVIVLVALGLPLAAILAWAFDVDDAGIRRADVAPPARHAGRASVAATPDDDGRRSIAVLPFVNMSGDPENEYFSDGIAGGDPEPARASCRGCASRRGPRRLPSRARRRTSATMAQRLGVTTILEGSVRRAGERVRITAQLIDDERRLPPLVARATTAGSRTSSPSRTTSPTVSSRRSR